MAWRFKLTGKTVNEANVSFAVDFYDDAAPAVVLHQHVFVVEPGALKTEVVGNVRQYGRYVRDRRAQADALSATFVVGEDAPV